MKLKHDRVPIDPDRPPPAALIPLDPEGGLWFAVDGSFPSNAKLALLTPQGDAGHYRIPFVRYISVETDSFSFGFDTAVSVVALANLMRFDIDDVVLLYGCLPLETSRRRHFVAIAVKGNYRAGHAPEGAAT